MTPRALLNRIKQAARDQETYLDLSSKGIKELPPEIGQLASLTVLNLAGNELTTLPPEIGQLTGLTELLLQFNQLTTLLPEIGQLTSLTKLQLFNNRLTALPPEIGQLTSLTILDLGSNQLKSLPPEIGRLTHLTLLLLDDNRLTSLPPEIGRLTDLTRLRLAGNRLTSLPPEIGQLSQLTRLDLGDEERINPITTLPPELGRLTALETLKLENLELTDPPPDIVEQGTKAILAYLRERLEQGTQIWESRLMVVGEGGVGKTQLLRALKGEDFQVKSETTHGINVIPLPLTHPSRDGVTMTLNAWDFGGQEIYHATHQFFLADRSLFLLVWNSRLGWEQGKLHYWLDTIKALAPDVPVMLVAAHCDERAADLPFDDLQKKYPQLVGKWSVSNEHRELGDGIDALRDALRTHGADLPLMGETAPASFWNTTKAIRELKKDNTWITADRLWKIMEDNEVSEAARPVLARQLHDLGELIHFHDDEELKDTVLLNPEFVTKNISNVLEYDGIEDGLGIFTREHMTECWSGVEETLRDRFLQLMERFDLSYRIPDDPENKSIVVERLSSDPIPFEDLWNTMHPDKGFREIRMKFDPQSTRPAGIPGWFIARSHRFTTHTHWRYGALFQDDRNQRRHLALLESSSQYRHVQLSIRGPNPHNFFAVLRDGLELTFNRFPGLVLKRTMPCPEQLKDGNPCTHEFDVADLENRLQLDPPKLTIECPKCYEGVSVTKLLFGLHWTTETEVLARLDEATEKIVNKLDEASDERAMILDELRELRELAQREFTNQFNRDQRLEESHCPRVFSLRPQDQTSWPKLKEKLFDKKWTLQLYCEAPGCWHPAPGGGEYTIDEPAAWKSTLAPYVGRLVKVFKYVAPLVAPGLGHVAPALADLLANDVKLMTALVKKLPDIKADRDLKAEHGLEVTDKTRAEGGASLRSLRHLLTELDPKQEWGDLRKTLTPEGHWLWLCEEHAEAYLQ